MENEKDYRRFNPQRQQDREQQESVYSSKVRAGKRRTYFFDVRRTKGNDFYLTLTESTKRFNGNGYERHKIYLYKEDFNRFLGELEQVISHIKTELMPDYDYDEFARRQEEYEARMREERELGEGDDETKKSYHDDDENDQADDINEKNKKQQHDEDDDMSW